MDSQTLISQMRQLDLWPDELSVQEELLRIQHQLPDGRQMGQEIIKRDLLSSFQINQILRGKGERLVVGPYRLIEKIGEGASCFVFKARHSRLHRIVALKIIRPELLKKHVAVQRFLREMEAVAKLSHPNVVRAYDADQINDTYYFTMQFLEGTNLSKFVRLAKSLSPQQACQYIWQASLGLDHIHQHGMVHRDIKPSNLMVLKPKTLDDSGSGSHSSEELNNPWGQIKILDLGLARLVEEEGQNDDNRKPALTTLGTVMGTTDYMSPEQALQSSKADIRSDIYSLGCTFYYALTGEPPYAGGNAVEKMLKHQLDPIPDVRASRSDLPEPMVSILQKMLAKKADDRYQSPTELAGALQECYRSIVPQGHGQEKETALIQEIVDTSRGRDLEQNRMLDQSDNPFAFGDTSSAPATKQISPVQIPSKEKVLWMTFGGLGVAFLICCMIAILSLLIR